MVASVFKEKMLLEWLLDASLRIDVESHKWRCRTRASPLHLNNLSLLPHLRLPINSSFFIATGVSKATIFNTHLPSIWHHLQDSRSYPRPSSSHQPDGILPFVEKSGDIISAIVPAKVADPAMTR